MERAELKAIIEAMIFVAEEPIKEREILAVFKDDGVEKDAVRECLASLEQAYNDVPERGLSLMKVAGGYQIRTRQSCAEWLRKLSLPKPMRLSQPALETLAIVAYRQPIMRSEVEKIRGVDSGGVIKTLLERRLLRIVGRSQEPGQPLLYGTTQEFLEVFNLNNLKELPTLKDIDDLMRERRLQLASHGDQEKKSAVDEEEDLTEVLEDDVEEDETEIIRRTPLDEDSEEEKKDMESLSDLESRLKDLRRIERHVFPKPIPTIPEQAVEGGQHDATSQVAESGGERIEGAAWKPAEEETASPTEDGSAAQHALAEDDRPFE